MVLCVCVLVGSRTAVILFTRRLENFGIYSVRGVAMWMSLDVHPNSIHTVVVFVVVAKVLASMQSVSLLSLVILFSFGLSVGRFLVSLVK